MTYFIKEVAEKPLCGESPPVTCGYKKPPEKNVEIENTEAIILATTKADLTYYFFLL